MCTLKVDHLMLRKTKFFSTNINSSIYIIQWWIKVAKTKPFTVNISDRNSININVPDIGNTAYNNVQSWDGFPLCV